MAIPTSSSKSKAPGDRADSLPIARVLPLLGLPQLDRGFDYWVSQEDAEAAQHGVRVRIRFGGRLTDAIILERLAHSEFEGNLRFIERVISPEVVYPEKTHRLVEALALRYGGTRSDLIRMAVPPRHAGAEKSDFDTSWHELGEIQDPDLSAWSSYQFGQSFVDAVLAGQTARAAWQYTPGEDWAEALAGLCVKVAQDGGGVLVVLPDQRDVDKLEKSLRELVSAKQITVLTAALGQQARYRRFLSVLQGQSRLVIGTRSAAFAPVKDLQLAVILDDGDENLSDPRAPYVHAREVLTTRSSQEGCSLIFASLTRTAEVQLMVEAKWAHGVEASRDTLRTRMPLIRSAADSDFEIARDPHATHSRLPLTAFEAAREALTRDRAVLVQVPRKGYIPTLACGNCRTPARCRECNGPLGLPTGDENTAQVPTCRWCGRPDASFKCGECGSPRLRAVVLGTDRTAEELGRAFPNTPVLSSGGNRMLDEVPDRASVIVATPGAEPQIADGGLYGAALLLDTWALLGRQDLRATEDTLHAWAKVAALVMPHRDDGRVIVVAENNLAPVQSLIRWDMVGAAARELASRREVGFPPAVHMAAVDGARASLELLLDIVDLPEGSDVLGPVPLPPGIKLPGEYDENAFGPAQRLLIRSPLGPRSSLGAALRSAATARALRRDDLPLRIQVDPVHVG